MNNLPLPIGQIAKNASEEIRVALQEFKGLTLLDMRVYGRFSAAKTFKPTTKGISLNPALLPELIRVLQAAECDARKLGLIPPAE
ncbi:transcriptional coactivator p15/PC4 family protein [Asticcacaulis sp. EMRT-3]|uniref:transcriptional coactivator p15/PC4 family protein n=1 Tax=Asticcacaulis sp. EMRT-3 TaxID=3040349 RepID=UPI0024AF82F6|nr:transcriptional coactivator p15/PC4 family protein [Asticcacaulis sp. EMRT-3]MDI7775513.1 transcriptional coactivator p15/PC4 family protein [Asticcacaulis sp. EMRT-3]